MTDKCIVPVTISLLECTYTTKQWSHCSLKTRRHSSHNVNHFPMTPSRKSSVFPDIMAFPDFPGQREPCFVQIHAPPPSSTCYHAEFGRSRLNGTNIEIRRKTTNEKALRETQTLRAGCTKVEPKIFAPPQTPFPGARDKRWSLPLPTNPVWWGSMHAISSYRGNKHTDRTDYNTLRR